MLKWGLCGRGSNLLKCGRPLTSSSPWWSSASVLAKWITQITVRSQCINHYRLPLTPDIRGVFSPNAFPLFPFFFTNVPGSPHASSHMPGHHLATVRRAGRKRGARFESSEALAEQPAVARSAVELHYGCCARVSRAAALISVNILTAWPGEGE